MKFWISIVLVSAVIASQSLAAEKNILKTQKSKNSYSVGLDVGNSLKAQGIILEQDAFIKGFKDAMSGSKPLLSDAEINASKTALQNELRAKHEKLRKESSGKNTKEGEQFLEANKKKDGVKTLPSGLQYKIMAEGKGESPKASDTVSVHYRGTLINGTEFDSSYRRGKPAEFPVNGVIAGWTEALQLMKPGAKWQLFIPSKLAYGEQGAGQHIGPNSVLVFEVELISVKNK
ncbi:MAG: FKBP-type peptidyl-prolyl cis-trans isomerase [Nitrospirae bacterium]|nr:MAG: FKBP-type peptidyl-prolyl cis-trans isomerase [Nitrospirota bacterium]